MYDVNSKHAEDFINHEEILGTLAYADENKHNIPLIESLIEKAALRKGLSHREASVLLACEDMDMNEKIFRLALERDGILADETLFIDDAAKNIEGARRLGIHGLHVATNADWRPALTSLLRNGR